MDIDNFIKVKRQNAIDDLEAYLVNIKHNKMAAIEKKISEIDKHIRENYDSIIARKNNIIEHVRKNAPDNRSTLHRSGELNVDYIVYLLKKELKNSTIEIIHDHLIFNDDKPIIRILVNDDDCKQ